MTRRVDMVADTNLMPHDLETEQAVLSTIMRYNNKYQECGDLLDADMFFFKKEQAMFRCLKGVIEGGSITDIKSLMAYANSHELDYELDGSDFIDILSKFNRETFGQDVERIRDMGRRRKVFVMLQEMSKQFLDLTEDFDEKTASVVNGMVEIHARTASDDAVRVTQSYDKLYGIISENCEGRKQFLRTGFRLFDNYYLLSPNSMTVLAAFPAVGKSALALNIAMAVARQNIPVAYYSLEMADTELAARTISNDMDVPAKVIMNRRLTDEQIAAFKKVTDEYRYVPLYFDDRSTVTFDRTVRSIRRMAKTKGIKLAIIDYLQIYAQVNDDMEKSISYMARSAKNIAKELGIAVLLLSQLNRSELHPSIKMLRGSGQIEESADNVVLIDRPDAYPDNKVTKYVGEFCDTPVKNTAKLILTKGRGVGTDCCLLGFDGAHTRFYEIEKAEGGQFKEHTEELPF